MSGRNNKKPTKKKSTLRVVLEILIVLIFLEFYAYRKLATMEYESMKDIIDNEENANTNRFINPQETRPLSPQEARKKRRQEERQKKRRKEPQKEKLERVQKKKATQQFNLTQDIDDEELEDAEERLKTAAKLKHMGVSGDVKLSELPPWSQIVENFNSYSQDDEPVILGLEHCEAFRENTDQRYLGVAPAGMFSTGTNLIATLTHSNCLGPLNRTSKFALVQTPYGKHNPADARFHHQVKVPHVTDRDAILPIVTIRHPYTWMSAMCKHSYQLSTRTVQVDE